MQNFAFDHSVHRSKRSAALMCRRFVARIVSDGCIHAELLTCSQKPFKRIVAESNHVLHKFMLVVLKAASSRCTPQPTMGVSAVDSCSVAGAVGAEIFACSRSRVP